MKKNNFSFLFLSLALFSLILVGAGCKKSKQEQEMQVHESATMTQEKSTSEVTIMEEESGESMLPGTTNPSVNVIGEEKTEMNDTENMEANATVNVEGTDPVKEFSIIARQWEFEPSNITVNKGDTVRLSITSKDVNHGFAISQFGVNTTITAGQTTVVEFVADKSGTFSFFCSVFCGAGHGNMRGTLTVN